MEENAVSEISREQKERSWGDRPAEEADQEADQGEKTYRDGSAAHECWAQDQEGV